jgi:recombination protein RecR
MNAYPPSLQDLIRRLSRLPGLGEKSATRIALHLLRAPGEEAVALADAIQQMKRSIQTCSRCFHFTDADVCSICRDPQRATGEMCVVETTAEMIAIEQSGAFHGRYHVLQGALSPLDGVGPENLRIRELLQRLREEQIQEVILATNPSSEGEATAHYLLKLLKDQPLRVSRIAYGIPMGGDIKYVDQVTIQKALTGRRVAD